MPVNLTTGVRGVQIARATRDGEALRLNVEGAVTAALVLRSFPTTCGERHTGGV